MKISAKFKFYTHHKTFLTLTGKNPPRLKRALSGFADLVFNIFYFFGSLIIALSVKIFLTLKHSLKNTKIFFPTRLKLLVQKNFTGSLLLFFLITIIGYLGIASLGLIAKALELKSDVTQTAALGNNYLSQAKKALSREDFSTADSRFALAYKTFRQGQQELASSGQLLNSLMSLLPQKQTADKLLKAAALVSQSGRDFVSLQSRIKSLRLGQSGISAEDGFTADALQNIGEQLKRISTNVTLANNLVNNLSPNELPAQNRQSFTGLKNKLQIAQSALENLAEVFSIAQSLLLGDKNVLVLFENNNELRAGGGFIGTYGNLKIKNGQISKINVSSIYDLDNQLNGSIQPPLPLLKVNSHWFMRDANWFADFPLSAKTVSSFYEMEGGETPDLIVAMTPNLILDWLKIIGPVTLPRYGVTLTPDNFVELTQVITTMSDTLPTNQPKQILADLVPVLLQKISGSSSFVFPQIIQSIQDNLNSKQVVIYSRDQNLQNMFEQFHWTGSIQSSDRDYLSIVSSNLGATKTDLSIEQKINLTTAVQNDGSVINELQISRTNKMPILADSFNRSFMRIYVPVGSKLISNLGFDYTTIDYPAGEKYQVSDDISSWEKNLVKDVVSGTLIGQESGKTFFGNWLELKGGETRTVKLVYQLPFKLGDIDKYSLLLQKQIGSTNQDFNWTVNFPNRKISWKNFSLTALNTDSLNSDIIVDKDYFFGMVLQKK